MLKKHSLSIFNAMNDLLFVYGSLLNKGNYYANYLDENAQCIGTGTFKGRLYDVGEYPGAILEDTNSYPITGTIFKLDQPQKALEILDDYEGFGPKQDLPNLFIRESLQVNSPDGQLKCWVYLYNFPVDGLTEIPAGNYQEYLKTKHKKSDG